MSTLNDRIAREVFEAHVRMAYSIAWKGVRRITALWGIDMPPEKLEELVQDGVCRGMGNFFRRCERGLPRVADRRAWVAQCVSCGVKQACCAKRAFGNDIPFMGYVDAMDRRGNPDGNRSARHGSDADRASWQEQVQYVPVEYPVQRWEIEALLEREGVPEKLRKTAVFAAMGISQEDSGKLQGCTDRTIRNRMAELREYLDPPCQRNVYSVVIEALQEISQ